MLGLSVGLLNIAYLLPMTIINLASLVIFLVAISRAKKGSYIYDMTDPEIIAMTKFGEGARDSSIMAKRLVYPSNVEASYADDGERGV